MIVRALDQEDRLLDGWQKVRCNDTVVFVRYEEGLPVELRTRCRNRHCQPEDGRLRAVHHWDLVGAHALRQRDEAVPRYDPRRIADQED